MQLIAYGAQDVYLTGNPQITFFKNIYKRHTNFAIEPFEQNIQSNIFFGNKVTCKLNRNGDIITKIYLKCSVSAYLDETVNTDDGKFAWVNFLGHSMISSIEMLIGGSIIDKQYGDWLQLWYELTRNTAHNRGYDKMIGNTEEMTKLSIDRKSATLYIPLQFFFNRYSGLGIPLIALQHHNVVFNIEFRKAEQLIVKEQNANVVVEMSECNMVTNYVYLDSDERKRFASSTHEYLIEQIQVSGPEKVNQEDISYVLNFNHPCKVMYWFMKNGNYITGKSFLFYVPDSKYIYRSGYQDENTDLLNGASIRYILSQIASVNGIIDLKLDGTHDNITNYSVNGITINRVTIKPKTDSLIDEDATTKKCKADISDWEVITPLSIDDVSKPIDEIFNGIVRTTDDDNEGHENYDVIVYQWNNFGKYLDSSSNPINSAVLKLNGHNRFTTQSGEYFNYLQAFETHKSTPKDGVNLYSFSLNPIEHQPSGTCNFSRIDNSSLDIKFDKDIIGIPNNEFSVYVINYNILRVMSGMAGIAYSN